MFELIIIGFGVACFLIGIYWEGIIIFITSIGKATEGAIEYDKILNEIFKVFLKLPLTINNVEKFNPEYIFNDLTESDTESMAEYQEGCNIDKLVEEEKSDWKDEIRRDLKMYCPDIFVEFIIHRFEEIKNDN